MKSRRLIYGIALAVCLMLIGCHTRKSQPELTIAVAANMQYAIRDIADKFTAQFNIPCNLVIGSSGKLTAQIISGAPFDLFLSADKRYPKKIASAKLTATPVRIYAHGILVLYSGKKKNTLTLDCLLQPSVRNIAVANPDTAPYGSAAKQFLINKGLFNAIESKLAYAESIAQVNQFVLSGAAQYGFTAMAAVRSKPLENRGTWIPISKDAYAPIEQGVVVLQNGRENKKEALQFYDYLFSEKAQQVLEAYGYELVDSNKQK